MPKINLVKFDTSDDGELAYKRRAKLAEALMTPRYPGTTPIAAGANIAGQALGAWMARENDMAEREAQSRAFDPLRQIVNDAASDTPSASPKFGAGGPVAESSGDPTERGERGVTARGQYAMARLTSGDDPLSPQAAAGVVGHLTNEGTGVNPNARGDGGTAFGIAQWRGPRFTNLQRFAKERGTSWNDLDTQIDFLKAEGRGLGGDVGAQRAWAALRSAKNPMEAAAAFMHYERPAGYTPRNPTGGHNFAGRAASANAYASAWAGDQNTAQADAPEPGAQVAQYAIPGQAGGGGGAVSEESIASSPIIASANKQMRAAAALMNNPRSANQGWELYMQAQQAKNAEIARLRGQEFQAGQSELTRQHQTSERVAGQQYQTDTRVPTVQKVVDPTTGQEVTRQYDPRTKQWVNMPVEPQAADAPRARNPEQEAKLRKEIETLDTAKAYNSSIIAYRSMVKAAKVDNRQSDINLIYGLAKLYDPTSVVREGEYGLVIAGQNLTEQAKGYLQSLLPGGKESRLTERTRRELIEQARIRFREAEDAYRQDADYYAKTLVPSYGIDPKYVVRPMQQIEDWNGVMDPNPSEAGTLAPGAPTPGPAGVPPGQPYKDPLGNTIKITPPRR